MKKSSKTCFYKYLPWLLFLWTAIAIPVSISPSLDGFYSKKGIIMGIMEGLLPAFLIYTACIQPVLKKFKAGKFITPALLSIVSLILWIAEFAELYIGIGLWCRINEAVLTLILQSDSQESTEFIKYALSRPATHKAFLISLIPFAAAAFGLLIRKPLHDFHISHSGKFSTVATAAALTVSGAAIIFAHIPLMKSENKVVQSYMLTPGQLLYAAKELDDRNRIRTSIAAANEKAEISLDGELQPLIIVIIGESDSKRHSSLYGYRLDTNPFLGSLAAGKHEDDGHFLIFNDVVTGDATTKYVMQRLMSTNSPEADWPDRPLLPAVLRKAGYSFGYFDNQSTPSTCENVDYSSVFFLNDAIISSQSIDSRNDVRFDYDGEFVDKYLPEALAMKEPAVVFFHLMGQHILAEKRYPADRAVFGLDDYAGIDTLSVEEKQTLMHYDNATAYTDSVISSVMKAVRLRDAIVIYLSDHAEELYDFRHQYGRSQEPVNPLIARTLYEVPMYIYFSPKAAAKRPELLATLRRRTNSRIHSYNLPDLILDIANVRGRMTSRKRSMASEDYDSTATRLIHHETLDYDSLMSVLPEYDQ